MHRTRSSMKLAALIVTVCASLTLPVAAQTETVLHNMKAKEGTSPMLGLIFDSAGNLYGAAGEGGAFNCGSVFELMPSGTSWTEKTLYSFKCGNDGSTPVATLIFDPSGNLYGTTKLGGSHGVGVAYKLHKGTTGTWTESLLHTFGGSGDGQYPTGNLIRDSAGNFYGTTEGGGAHGNGQENIGGTAFKIAPKTGGGWTETIMRSFGGSGDGISPRANLVRDSSGSFYGTTFAGGTHSSGIVFKLSPKSGGGWTEKILHNFDPTINFGSTDGTHPSAGLTFDSSGNLYGTTVYGGDFGGGVAFKLAPTGTTWTETVLYPFNHTFYRPSFVYSGLIFDNSGNLYGATLVGGLSGSVFELMPTLSGYWNSVTLYNFDSTHGSGPANGYLIFDSAGNLYGATQNGGTNKVGVVFKVTP